MNVLELTFSSTEEGTEDKIGDKNIIWKDILREGDFPITPGRKRKIPFKVVPSGKSSVTGDLITISMSELMKSYDDKAFESVTIPLRHPKPEDKDDVLNNSGYVEGLRVVKKNNRHVMQAGLGFTEPDIGGKVRRGTIPNVSSGIVFDFTRKADGTKFPSALNHVCLTKTPWIDDLEPFKKVYASDDVPEDTRIDVVDFDDEETAKPDKAEIVWNENDSFSWVRSQVQVALNPPEPRDPEVPMMPRPMYDVMDISRDNTALVTEWFKGDQRRWVIPFDIGEDKVTVSPATRWVEVREAMIAASDTPAFDERTFTRLVERLSEQLSVNLGDVGRNFVIDDISTDGYARIDDDTNGVSWIARFVDFGDSVALASTSDWERTTRASNPAAETLSPSSAAPSVPRTVPVFNMDTPEGRVAAARNKRRQMMSRNSQ